MTDETRRYALLNAAAIIASANTKRSVVDGDEGDGGFETYSIDDPSFIELYVDEAVALLAEIERREE